MSILCNISNLLARLFIVCPVVGERRGSVVECRTPEREVRSSKPTAAVLCPWARHFTPRKYWLLTQEAMAPSRYDWKIVDWDVKPQHNQPTNMSSCTLWSIIRLSPVKRICVFEHSVMTNFYCACPAIQRGQRSGFLSDGSSWFTACMSEQLRFWRDCADAQARLNLRCSLRR